MGIAIAVAIAIVGFLRFISSNHDCESDAGPDPENARAFAFAHNVAKIPLRTAISVITPACTVTFV